MKRKDVKIKKEYERFRPTWDSNLDDEDINIGNRMMKFTKNEIINRYLIKANTRFLIIMTVFILLLLSLSINAVFIFMLILFNT